MKKLYTLVLCSLGLTAISQQSVTPTYNNVKFTINSEGSNFTKSQLPSFTVPATGNVNTIYASNLWLFGSKPNGQLAVAAETYGGSSLDFRSGPIAPVYDNAYDQKFNRVWNITKVQIDEHIARYKDLTYITPEVILNWPAQTVSSDPFRLAPFYDTDGDGLYDPSKGDYPGIKGDYAVFSMKNDARSPHISSGGDPIVIQINTMYYGYAASTGFLSNSLFVTHEMVNCGSNLLKDFRFGVWNDFDLGNPGDDYVGTSSSQNAIYCYNGDSNDDINGGASPGYGLNPPVQSFSFLNQSLESSVSYTNGGGITGDPTSSTDYAFYLSGKDRSGQNFPSPHFCDGDPGANTGQTESKLSNTPGDRRMLATANLGDFFPGQVRKVDAVYIWSRSTGGSYPGASDDIDSAKTFYDQDQTSINEYQTLFADIYPNPATTHLTITLANHNELSQAIIRNTLGQIVLHSTSTNVNIEALPAGLFTIELITSKGQHQLKSFLKQ